MQAERKHKYQREKVEKRAIFSLMNDNTPTAFHTTSEQYFTTPKDLTIPPYRP